MTANQAVFASLSPRFDFGTPNDRVLSCLLKLMVYAKTARDMRPRYSRGIVRVFEPKINQ